MLKGYLLCAINCYIYNITNITDAKLALFYYTEFYKMIFYVSKMTLTRISFQISMIHFEIHKKERLSKDE